VAACLAAYDTDAKGLALAPAVLCFWPAAAAAAAAAPAGASSSSRWHGRASGEDGQWLILGGVTGSSLPRRPSAAAAAAAGLVPAGHLAATTLAVAEDGAATEPASVCAAWLRRLGQPAAAARPGGGDGGSTLGHVCGGGLVGRFVHCGPGACVVAVTGAVGGAAGGTASASASSCLSLPPEGADALEILRRLRRRCCEPGVSIVYAVHFD
jgi:hypothetical protein